MSNTNCTEAQSPTDRPTPQHGHCHRPKQPAYCFFETVRLRLKRYTTVYPSDECLSTNTQEVPDDAASELTVSEVASIAFECS